MENLLDLDEFAEKIENENEHEEVKVKEEKNVVEEKNLTLDIPTPIKNPYVIDETLKIDINEKIETNELKINQDAMKINIDNLNEEKLKSIKFAVEDDLPLSEYEKIKDFALTFQFELDVFQKRSLVRLENKQV